MLDRYDVSAIVCIYNVEEYIEQSLDSLYAQTGVRMQVILYDDCSTDRSGEIAQRYAAEHPDTVYIRGDVNRGISRGRNTGAEMAKGKYITWFDPDDLLAEGIYEKLFRAAEDRGCEIALCRAARIKGEHVIPSYAHEMVFSRYRPVTNIVKTPELLYDTTIWTKLILRSFYRKHRFEFPEERRNYEDIPVVIPMHYLCAGEAMVRDIGYFWRIREGENRSNTQRTNTEDALAMRLASMRDVDGFFREHVKEEDLVRAKMRKVLDVDLNIFANQCKRLPEGEARLFMREIREYIREAVDPSALETLSVVKRQKFEYILRDDLEGLLKLLRYAEKDYALAPVVQGPEKKLSLILPADIFALPERNPLPEMKNAGPLTALTGIAAAEKAAEEDENAEKDTAVPAPGTEKLLLSGYTYFKRVSVPAKKPQKNEAWLVCMETGKKYPLAAEPSDEGKRLTKRKTKKPDERTEDMPPYNYNGTGFRVLLDLREIAENGEIFGECRIRMHCRNRFLSGDAWLAKAREAVKEAFEGRTDTVGETTVLWRFDPFGELVLTVSRGEEAFSLRAKRGAKKIRARLGRTKRVLLG